MESCHSDHTAGNLAYKQGVRINVFTGLAGARMHDRWQLFLACPGKVISIKMIKV